jgi:hypothetical protein
MEGADSVVDGAKHMLVLPFYEKCRGKKGKAKCHD